MPCRFIARGTSLKLLTPSGDSSLQDMLRSAVSEVGGNLTGRIEGIVSLPRGDCEFAMDLENGVIITACVDCGTEHTGNEAVEALKELLNEVPSKGYVEIMKLSKAALELDVSTAPNTQVNNALRLEDLLSQTSRNAGDEDSETIANPDATETPQPRPSPSEEVVGVGGELSEGRENPVSMLTLANNVTPDIIRESPEVFLANMVIHSKTIDLSMDGSNLASFINRAKELSSTRTDKAFRLVVTLKSGETYNIFFHGGKPCVVFKHTTLYDGVKQLDTTNMERHLGSLEKNNIKHILLCEVSNPLIVRSIEKTCNVSPPASTLKRTARRKHGLLSKLLGRR